MAEIDSFRAETREWLLADAPKSIVGITLGGPRGTRGGRRPRFDPPDPKPWPKKMIAERGWTAPARARECPDWGLEAGGAEVRSGEVARRELPAFGDSAWHRGRWPRLGDE